MVAGVGRGTEILGQQLARSALTAEGEQGEIEFGRAAAIRDGILLKKASALAKALVARFPLNDTDAPCNPHDDEIRFHRVVIEIEEQLEQTGGGTEERHFPALKVGLERIEALPELFKVLRVANPAGNLKAFEVGGERTAVADDTVERTSTLNDAGNLAAKAKVAKSGPVGGKYALRVTTGEDGGVKPGEGFLENRRFNKLANQRRA